MVVVHMSEPLVTLASNFTHSIKVTLFYVPTINESGSIIEDICWCITMQDGNENLVL